jgi:bifunctional UDP-N-acetylglucosamine pyrophosphorylase/glucosamine-1-phosphate N-acetyltransferase
MNLSCVILAAGHGTRMKSTLPKVLHTVCGIPMLQAVVSTAKKLKPDRIVIVAGKDGNPIKEALKDEDLVFALQKEARGTGHALRCARPALKNEKGIIVVLNGDSPLVRSDTIRKFLRLHRQNMNAVSVLSFSASNPDGYGRIVRDASSQVVGIVEQNDAAASQKEIREVNSGVYALQTDALFVLDEIRMNRSKGEYYLTDIVAAALRKKLRTAAYCVGAEDEFMGVNTRRELYEASRLMKKRIIDQWIDRGVLFLDTDSVFIHPDVSIGEETTLYPNVYLEGRTKIGRGSIIYPNVRIRNSEIGNGVVIMDSTVIEDSRIKDRASVGPFARLRSGSDIGSEVRIGNFVELKKSVIGKASKAAHLSYLGDAIIGKDVNIGAGTITCNYDGVKKNVTKIEDNVFIGSDTQLVAPVRIGRGAYVGAGSTITQDVPPLSLAISRTSQKTIEGWAQKRKLKAKKSKKLGVVRSKKEG